MTETESAPDPGPEDWTVRLRDQPGALERILGVLRRRLVPIDRLALDRGPQQELTIALRVRPRPGMEGRIRAEVAALVDVVRLEWEPPRD